MLIDDYTHLSQLAQDFTDIKKHASDLGKFRDRQTKIEELLKDLKPMVIALKIFRERELISVDLSQKADGLLAELVTTLSAFQKERGWLLEKFKLNTLKLKVDDLKSDLNRQLRQAWTNYRNRRIPITNSELLGLLAKIQTFKPTVQKICTLRAQIDTVDFPKDAHHFQEIDRVIDNLRTEWNSLKSDEVPPIVLDFLRDTATSHGAAIGLLTPEVKEWLYEHEISQCFSIRISD